MKLRGFFVSISCPTEARFLVTVDCSKLSGPAYLELVGRLQDVLSFIDQEHKKKFSWEFEHSRSLKARYIKQSYSDERKRLLSFYPVPTTYIAKIKNIRAYIYEQLRKYAIVIEQVKMGNRKENIYIMPPENTEKFLAAVDSANMKLREVVEKVKRFNMDDIDALLSRYDIGLPYREVDEDMKIVVDLIPISLTSAIEEWAQQSPRVRSLLERKERELAEQIARSLAKRLEPTVKRIEEQIAEAAMLKDVERIRMRIEKVKKMALGVGLEEFSSAVCDPLIELTENPEKVKEFREKGEKLDEWISGRIESLFY